MNRNLSLIPTIEAEPEAAPPSTPARAAPVRAPTCDRLRPVAVDWDRPARAPTREGAPHVPRRGIAVETLEYVGIVLLFAAVAWPLYLWIGK